MIMNEEKFEKRYQKIVDELVEKSFPSLKNEKIIVKEKDMKSFARADYLPFLKRIRVGLMLRKADNKTLAGLFAHELCHFEDFKKKGYLITFICYILHKFSDKFRRKLEKETDRLTIRKGYGNELIKITSFVNKRRTKKRKHFEKNYLKVEEIKQEMKKLKRR